MQLLKTAENCMGNFEQYWTIAYATRMRVLGTVRIVMANQTPPFSLITMHTGDGQL